MEKEVGKVADYLDKIMVAVVKLSGDLVVGDTIKFIHGEKEFSQKVESMQVEHKPVQSGRAGDEVAIKVEQEAHKNAHVHKVEE